MTHDNGDICQQRLCDFKIKFFPFKFQAPIQPNYIVWTFEKYIISGKIDSNIDQTINQPNLATNLDFRIIGSNVKGLQENKVTKFFQVLDG